MRILHTADWHLGKMFYGEYLTDDQEYVLRQQFLPLLKEAAVDVVVIAGDMSIIRIFYCGRQITL